jgi:hypothetical protein
MKLPTYSGWRANRFSPPLAKQVAPPPESVSRFS